MSSRRSVAIESGTWRSVRMGSASWAIIVGNARDFEDSAATRFRGGKSGPLRDEEPVGCNAKCGVVVNTSPTPSLEMAPFQSKWARFPASIRDNRVRCASVASSCAQGVKMSRIYPVSKARISSVLFHLLAIPSTAIPRESFLLPHRDRGPGAP